MFFSYFKSNSQPFFDTLSLATRATFQPTKTGQEIELGSPDDFGRRVSFFLKLVALTLGVQAIFGWAIGLSVWPQSVDALAGFIGPIFSALVFLLLYAPLRLFRWTKLPFSHYFQAAATSQGVAVFLLPFTLLPAAAAAAQYGKLELTDRAVILAQAAAPGPLWRLCANGMDSLVCYGMFAAATPDLQWTSVLQQVATAVLVVPMAKLIKSATGIAYWKQIAAFILICVALAVAAAAVMSAGTAT